MGVVAAMKLKRNRKACNIRLPCSKHQNDNGRTELYE